MAIFIGVSIPSLVLGRAVAGVAMVLALLCIALLPSRKACLQHLKKTAGSPLGLLVCATMALWLPAVVFSLDPMRSFEAWARTIVFISGAVMVWGALAEEPELLELSLRVLLLASGVAVVVALVALFGPRDFLSIIRLKSYFVRPEEALKGFAAVTMLMVPVVWWAGRRLGGYWAKVGIALVLCFLVIIAEVKNMAAFAGLCAMVIVFGLYIWSKQNLTSSILVTLALVVGIASLIVTLYVVRGDLKPHPEIDFDYAAPIWLIDYLRQVVWSFSLEKAWESPWIGHGINVVNFLPGADQAIHTSGINFIPGHPHNWAIEIFAETGLVGLLPLVVVVVALIVRLGQVYFRSRDAAVLMALAVNVGYWGSGLSNFSFWSAWWQVSFMALIAICLAGQRRAPADSPPGQVRS
jgi:O-antigen ligase